MLFWFFVILTIMGIAVKNMAENISAKYGYGHNNDKKSKFVEFVWLNEELLEKIGNCMLFIGLMVTMASLAIIVISQLDVDAKHARNEQRYNSLIYKTQTESIRDEFGIVNKEYIDEVQNWNEELSEYQAYSNNPWVGIFYPKRVFDGFEIINLEDIKMRDKGLDESNIKISGK